MTWHKSEVNKENPFNVESSPPFFIHKNKVSKMDLGFSSLTTDSACFCTNHTLYVKAVD